MSRNHQSAFRLRFRGVRSLASLLLSAALPFSAPAQSNQTQSNAPQAEKQATPHTISRNAKAPSTKADPAAPPAAQAAQLASVTLKSGTLTIAANDSDLTQILQEICKQSGMVINGEVQNTRVFGNYGPKKPGEVLNELLSGLGYNIIMVGTSLEDAPRELQVTGRSNAPLTAEQPKTPLGPEPEKEEEPQLGPGAIAHPKPEPPDDPQQRTQTNLQRLQQMHDAREKQEQEMQNAPH